jgi:ethanolaminephosphotransferase
MSIVLDSSSLLKIKNYKYQTNGLTFIETRFYNHFWNYVASLLPKTLAPNLLTLLGLIIPFMQVIALFYLDWTFT